MTSFTLPHLLEGETCLKKVTLMGKRKKFIMKVEITSVGDFDAL